jgi:hypothetical protein
MDLWGESLSLSSRTQADVVAVLVQLLVAFGNAVGRSAFFLVGATEHRANINALIVGKSGKATPGTTRAASL